MPEVCPCDCHGRWQAPCSIEGGCGHLHQSATRCRSGQHCKDGETVYDDTGEPAGRLGGVLTSGVVCDGCAQATATAIRALPFDYLDLSGLLGPSLTPKYRDPELPPPAGKPEPKLPLRVDVLALQELIGYETVVWAESVADACHLDWEASNGPRGVRRACDLLADQLTALLNLGPTEHRARSLFVRRADGHDPDRTTRNRYDYWTMREGWEAALKFRELHDRAERLLGKGRADRIPIPCPTCHSRDLVREQHNSHVVCRSCNKPMSDRDYEVFRNTVLRAYGLPEIEISLVVCRRCDAEFNPDSPRCPFCGTNTDAA